MINTQCARTIYKQTTLPLLDYVGFLLIACNILGRSDIQKLQIHALRICYNVRLRDKVSIVHMHARAGLLSLIYKQRCDVARVHGRMTRAAQHFAFARERYHCIKYKNSPYYKGALLWDSLPIETCNSICLLDFKRRLNTTYKTFDNRIT